MVTENGTCAAKATVKRLLMVATSAATVKAFLLPFADHFRSMGWRVDALANDIENHSGCKQHFDEVHEIGWTRRPLAIRNLLAAREVRSVVARGGYDIVHVHTPVAAFITRVALARPFSGRRPVVIYTAHGFHFHPGNNWLSNLGFASLERMAGRWTDFLVTINRTDQLAAMKLGLVPPGRVRYMPGIGVDRARFHPAAPPDADVDPVRQQFGIRDAAPVFVMIAEFIPRKRHQDALRAFAHMRNQHAHMVFVGEGPGRQAIERQAAESGVADRVHFAGAQDDVRPFIFAARAVILTSSQEGLPRSLLEALSCGIPAIGSDIRGTSDLLSKGGGVLFPVGDIMKLASQLEWFADNQEKAAEMGARAWRCTEECDTANIIAMHDELYASTLGAGTGIPLRTHS